MKGSSEFLPCRSIKFLLSRLDTFFFRSWWFSYTPESSTATTTGFVLLAMSCVMLLIYKWNSFPLSLNQNVCYILESGLWQLNTLKRTTVFKKYLKNPTNLFKIEPFIKRGKSRVLRRKLTSFSFWQPLGLYLQHQT